MARPKKDVGLGASAVIGVRITPELRSSLEDLAREHNRLLAEEVRVALQVYVKLMKEEDDNARTS